MVGAVEILHRGNKVYTPVQSIHNAFALLEKNVNNKGFCVMDLGRREMRNTGNLFI